MTKNNINNLIVNSIYFNIKNNFKNLYNSYQFKTINQKYKLKFILSACVHFINISCSYKNFIYFNLNHNTFYKNFIKLNRYKIFESTYKLLLHKYLNKYKNKRVIKLSLITTDKGIPLNVDLYKGNINDINI